MELDKDFKEFVELLNENKVDYLVVGGYSVAYHGFPRYTGDFDIWVKPTLPNGEKIINVLEEFGFGAMGLVKGDFTNYDKVIQFGVEPLRIDILTTIDGISDFEEAFKERETSLVDNIKINFIGYSQLIKNKKASNRLQDQRDVKELNKIKGKTN